MAVSTLTEAETKKLKQVVSRVQGLPKGEKAVVNTARFADKYLRHKLGRRGTGPHSHGLNEKQRADLKAAINKAFSIPVSTPNVQTVTRTRARQAAAQATPARQVAARRQQSRPGTGSQKSAAQLAAEQQARAAQS